jgi:hypothetical protein
VRAAAISEILFWVGVALTIALALSFIVGPHLRRRREAQEQYETLLAEVAAEPWRAPELGPDQHWMWCQLGEHEGRCHTRMCGYSRDHDGPCWWEGLGNG